jgi:hypothetical protein
VGCLGGGDGDAERGLTEHKAEDRRLHEAGGLQRKSSRCSSPRCVIAPMAVPSPSQNAPSPDPVGCNRARQRAEARAKSASNSSSLSLKE